MENDKRVPLLLLHGFPMTAAMWRHTVAHFEGNRDVVAPEAADLVAAYPDKPSMASMAIAAKETLDRQAPDAPAVVVGLSMGGYIALEFARQFPDRVAALALCDTRCTADTPEAMANRDAMIQAVREDGVIEGTAPLVGKLLSPSAPQTVHDEVSAMVTAGDRDIIVTLIEALRDRRDLCSALEGFQKPVLVVRGADDVPAPKETAEQMLRLAPHGRYAEVPSAGHVPPLEAPEVFNRELEEFLSANGL